MSEIQVEQSKFLGQLLGGKLDWTRKEFAACWLEPKRDGSGQFGPIDESRAPLVAKVCGQLLDVVVTKTAEGFCFSKPSGLVPALTSNVQFIDRIVEKIVEVPVEKVVEKLVERTNLSREELETEVQFPELPLPGKRNPDYVQPAWHKRMVAALEAGKHVSIAGPPGGGKSTAPEQYFISKGQPFVTINGDAGFRRRDMEGNTEIQNGTTFFRVAEFAAAAVNGWGCILNEVNAADPDALMYINGLLEVPFVVNIHGKAYPVHKDFRLVITYNPGLVGTKALPQAFKDRFFPIKLGFPVTAFLRKVLVARGMKESAAYAERLLKYAADCWKLHEKGNLRYQISPRRLFDVVFLMDSVPGMTIEDAIKSAIIDSVDSSADCQMLITLVTTPLKDIGAVSQYG